MLVVLLPRLPHLLPQPPALLPHLTPKCGTSLTQWTSASSLFIQVARPRNSRHDPIKNAIRNYSTSSTTRYGTDQAGLVLRLAITATHLSEAI